MAPVPEKVACAICAHQDHILVQHIVKKHAMQPTEYLAKFPTAPLWSAYGFSKVQEHSKSSLARMQPRPRELTAVNLLFPDFGKRSGLEISGEYPIFKTPGPLTPLLDSNYVFPEEQTLDVLTILAKPKRNRIFIKGFSGTGKTCLIFNLAAKCNAEVMEWNADSFQQRSSLIGRWISKDGETVWQDGILPLAMKRGCWLVINEVDCIDPHTLNILKPMLEDPPRLTVLENGGEVIQAHPDFRVIATANTWARGDSTGMFVNTHVQSDADARRWSARILLDYMTEDVEDTILETAFPELPQEDRSNFIKVANRVRDAFKAGRIDKTFSPAEVVCWCENYIVCAKGVHHAARLSFLNALEPDVQTAIGEMVNAVFGQE